MTFFLLTIETLLALFAATRAIVWVRAWAARPAEPPPGWHERIEQPDNASHELSNDTPR